MTQTISKFYEGDHDRLDEIFKTFQMEKTKDLSAAQKAFSEFKTGLERHISWEEEILFPLFEERTGIEGAGPSVVMRMEHRQIKEMLAAIFQKILRRNPKCDTEEADLLSILSAHNMKEEGIIYPAIDRLLQSSEVDRIFQQMGILV
jgi:iron-sulfur cluster repair protein YtfE (RIC family)